MATKYSASQKVFDGYSQATNCPMVPGKRFCGCTTGDSGTTISIYSCDSEIPSTGISHAKVYITSAVTFWNDAISNNTRLNKKSNSTGANSLYTDISDEDDVVLTYYTEHSNYTYLHITPLLYMYENDLSIQQPEFATAIYNYLTANPGYVVQEHTVVMASLYSTIPSDFSKCKMSASLSDAAIAGDVGGQIGVISGSTQVVVENTISFSDSNDYGGWNVSSWQYGTYTYPSINEMSSECGDAFDKAIYSGGADVYATYNCIMPAWSAMESGSGRYELNYSEGSSEIYVAVKTCIWYTGGPSGLDSISSAIHEVTCFGAIEVWGPFYRIYAPSGISISADSKLKLNTSYDSSLSFPNIPGETVVYNSPVTINYTITTPSILPGYAYLYDDCTLSSTVGTATWNYASSQTTGNSITDNLEITLKSARLAYSSSSSVTGNLTSTNGPYQYSSSIIGHYNSKFTITSYNAYAIYIYDAANCTDNGTSVSITGSPIAILNDNAGVDVQTCDGVLTGINGTAKSYYIREVLEEQTSSGSIRVVSYNSTTGAAVSVYGSSRMASTPTLNSRTLTSDNGSMPLTTSSSSTAISMSNVNGGSAQIWKLTFTPSSISDSNDGIINLTTGAYSPSGNNIVLNIGQGGTPYSNFSLYYFNNDDENNAWSSSSSSFVSIPNVITASTSPAHTFYADVYGSSDDIYLHIKTVTSGEGSIDTYYYDTTDSDNIVDGPEGTQTGQATLGDEIVFNCVGGWPDGDVVTIVITYNNVDYTFNFTFHEDVPVTALTTKYIANTNNSAISTWTGTATASTSTTNSGSVWDSDNAYFHIKVEPTPSNATHTSANISLQDNTAGAQFVSGNTGFVFDFSNELIIRASQTGSFTLRLIANPSSNSITYNYTFDVTLYTSSTTITIDPQPTDVPPNTTDAGWFGVSIDGDESLTVLANGLRITPKPDAKASYITGTRKEVDTTNNRIKVYYSTASTTEDVTGLAFNVLFQNHAGSTIQLYTENFSIVAPLSSITATHTGWSNAENQIISISDIIWFGSSTSLNFGVSTVPSGRTVNFEATGGAVSGVSTTTNSSTNITCDNHNEEHESTNAVFSFGSINAGYSFVACKYTSSFTPKDPSTGVISIYGTKNSTGTVKIEYNGDEYCTGSSPELTFVQSASVNNSSLSCSINTSSYANPTSTTYGSATYIIRVTDDIRTSTTATISKNDLYCTGKNGRVNSNKDITINIEVEASKYEISIQTDKSTVYVEDPITLTISRGEYVDSYSLTLPVGVEYRIGTSGSWTLTSGTSGGYTTISNLSASKVQVRNSYSSILLYNKTITVTAEDKDDGASNSSYSTDSVNVTFGTVTYATAIQNGTGAVRDTQYNDIAYIGDRVTFSSTYVPKLGTVSAKNYWGTSSRLTLDSSTASSSGSGTNSSTVISYIGIVSTGSGAASIQFDGNGSASGTSTADHTFSIDTIRSRNDDTISLTGGIIVVKGVNGEIRTADVAVSRSVTISSVDSVSIVESLSQDAASKNLSVTLITNSGRRFVRGSVNGLPNDPDNENYTLQLIGTNDIGDTVTVSNAGTLQWRIGRDSYVFESDPSTNTVNGNSNQTATYIISCSYKDGGTTVYCTDVIIDTSNDSWWSASIAEGTGSNANKMVLTVTTTKKNYTTSSRTANITLKTYYNATESTPESISISFVQSALLVTTTITLTSSSSNVNIGTNSASATYLTAGSNDKEFNVVAKRIEQTSSGSSGTEYLLSCTLSGSVSGFTSNLTGNAGVQTLTLSSSDNQNSTAARSGDYTLTASYADNTLSSEEQSALETNYPKTYTVSVSQPGCSYNSFSFIVNNTIITSNTPVTYEIISKGGNWNVPISCTYNKVVDGTTEQKIGRWKAVYTKPEWINSISPASNVYTETEPGFGISLSSVESNPYEYVRESSISVTADYFEGSGQSASCNLTLRQNESNIEFAESSKTIPANSTGFTTSISSNNSWSILTTPAIPSWMSISPLSGNTGDDITIEITTEQNYSDVNDNDYVKYRTDTSTRSYTITAKSASSAESTLDVTQSKYTWNRVCTYTSNISVNADVTLIPITIKSNYQIKLVKASGEVVIPDGGIAGPSFETTDLPSVEKTYTYDIPIKCNNTDTAKVSVINIEQVHHSSEDSIETKTIQITQSARLIDTTCLVIKDSSDNVIAPIGDTGSGEISFDAAGAGTVKTIKVRTKLGGWGLDTVSSSYINGPASDRWMSFSTTSGTYVSNENTAYAETSVVITCNLYTEVNNAREKTITFVHDGNPNVVKVNLTIRQTPSEVHFAIVEDTDNNPNDPSIFIALKQEKENNPVISGRTISYPDISSNYSGTFYVYYYHGGYPQSQPTVERNYPDIINVQVTQITSIPAEADWTLNNQVEKIYRYDISIPEYEGVNPEGLTSTITINSAANISNSIIINITQSPKSYDASFDFGDGTGIGDYVGDKWILPIYGGEYSIYIRNILWHDSINIKNIYVDTDSNLNPDNASGGVVDTSSWAEFSYKTTQNTYNTFDINNPVVIGPRETKEFKIHVKEYSLNENLEPDPTSNSSNIKIYQVKVVANSTSSARDVSANVKSSGSEMSIQAIQTSKNILANVSWRLLSDSEGKVYNIGNFDAGQTKILYSEDTGYTLRRQGVNEHLDDELTVIKNIVISDSNAVLDERFGVR